NILLQQTAENVETGRIRDGIHRIDAARNLRRTAAEVNCDQRLALGRRGKCQRDRNPHRPGTSAIIIKKVLSFITSMRDPAQESAHELLRIILQLLHYL